ncbi:exodeoxyribonuclease V subunit alpha [Mycobacterium sp.]|uniref:exodeoxyribonuclease V subunit alpha n=1 Tax=Mycobacterium sp. TaxID=1785 RepID=UPI003BAC1E8C
MSWRRTVGAAGLLRVFNDADVIGAADVHVAQRVTTMAGESDPHVMLALALLVRALRGGSVCLDLQAIKEQIGGADLPWPAPESWLAAVRASPLVRSPTVLRIDANNLLYLDRYWREEQQAADDLLALLPAPGPVNTPRMTAATNRLFPPGYEEQGEAASVALSQGLTVLTGGPGTGKTTTVARLLALFAEQAQVAGLPRLRMALAAPTGKAAASLQEAVRVAVDQLDSADRQRLSGLQATTLHRLLGRRPDTSSRFRHHRGNRLPHDVIVVDETSMVSLTMMARLLEAVRPTTRLLLAGDPNQLSSVEAGAVLADLVDGFKARGSTPVVTLKTAHRFGESIGELAESIRAGDVDRVIDVLSAGGDHVEWIHDGNPADSLRNVLVPQALQLRQAAILGDASTAISALDEHRLLCAHRHGPYGVAHWNQQIERWLTDATGEPIWSSWYAGRPVLVTTTNYGLGIYNGDNAVTVARDGRLRVAFAAAGDPLEIAPSRLSDVDTMYAMTIHKSQGSQADDVTVLLPSANSRLLTRELFYTAVTRAKRKVRVVGSMASVRAAIERRALRATGLRLRLRAAPR